MDSGIPIISLKNFTSGGADPSRQKETVKAWGNAMRQFGFAIVVDHGISTELKQAMFAASKRFFLEKSLEEKMKFNFGSYGNPRGGFTAQGIESVGRTFKNTVAAADLVESYVLNTGAMQEPSIHEENLFKIGKLYREEATKVMHVLHKMSALALGLREDFFDEFFQQPRNSLRLAHYPPLPDHIETGQLRYAPHYDYEGFTILALDEDEGDEQDKCEDNGLEVFVEGQWRKVRCPRGGLVVNIGELITYWTNGEWKSTLHRVVNPDYGTNKAKKHRFSLPFFTAPHANALVKPIFGDGTAKPIRAHDHLMMQLQKSNL